MTDADTWGVLATTPTGTSVRLERRFDCDVETLWEAITAPERVGRWLGALHGDLRVGGVLELRMGEDAPGAPDAATARVVRCEAHRRLVLEWSFPGEQPSRVSVTLDAADGGSSLLLVHERLTLAGATGYGSGWHTSLDQLDDHLAGRPVRDWDARFGELVGPYREQGRAPLGSIVVQGRLLGLRLERTLRADRDEVWSALTEPARVARWIGDLQVSGSHYTLTFLEEGHPRTVGEILHCEPGHRLLVTWTHEGEPTTELEVTLTDDDAAAASDDAVGGTRLVLAHSRLPRGDVAVYGAGWHEFLDVVAGELGEPPSVARGFDALLPGYRAAEAEALAGRVVADTAGSDATA